MRTILKFYRCCASVMRIQRKIQSNLHGWLKKDVLVKAVTKLGHRKYIRITTCLKPEVILKHHFLKWICKYHALTT